MLEEILTYSPTTSSISVISGTITLKTNMKSSKRNLTLSLREQPIRKRRTMSERNFSVRKSRETLRKRLVK